MYSKLIVDILSPSGLRWVAGRNKGKPAGCLRADSRCPAYKTWRVKLNGKTVLAHRVVYELTHGLIPAGFLVDHINGEPSDNRPENLRLAAYTQNAWNRKRGVDRELPKGVSKTRSDTFKAEVVKEGKAYTKNFKTPEEAHEWVKAKRCEIHSDFARD